jgi:hypothetical protein
MEGRLPSRRKAFVCFQEKPESGLFRSVSGVGVAKSLARAGAGPVIMVLTQKVEIKSEKPL